MLHVTRSNGQALIGVLAVVAIASAIVATLVLNSLINADSSLRLRQSANTVYQAEGVLQNAILRLERDPSYSGEVLTLSDGQIIIEVTGANPKIVLAKSITSDGKILRKLQVQVVFSDNGSANISNWQEVN